MSPAPLTPEKQAEIEELEQAIREAGDAEIGELAANLATTDDAHLVGRNEFTIRVLAHKIAATAVEQHLAQKKEASPRTPPVVFGEKSRFFRGVGPTAVGPTAP